MPVGQFTDQQQKGQFENDMKQIKWQIKEIGEKTLDIIYRLCSALYVINTLYNNNTTAWQLTIVEIHRPTCGTPGSSTLSVVLTNYTLFESSKCNASSHSSFAEHFGILSLLQPFGCNGHMVTWFRLVAVARRWSQAKCGSRNLCCCGSISFSLILNFRL